MSLFQEEDLNADEVALQLKNSNIVVSGRTIKRRLKNWGVTKRPSPKKIKALREAVYNAFYAKASTSDSKIYTHLSNGGF